MGIFGFLKKGKKGAKEEAETAPAPAESVELEFDDVRAAVEKALSARMAGEREEAEELYDRIKFNLIHIRKLAAELDRKSFEKGDKIYAPVNMTKGNYVKKASSLLASVPNVEDFGYHEMADFCKATGKILNELMNIPPKQAVLLTRYFKGESSKIVLRLKETEEMRKKLDSLLGSGTLKIAGEINAKIDALSELLEKASDYKRHELAVREKMKDKEKELKEAKASLDAFFSEGEALAFRGMEEEAKKMGAEMDGISAKINDELSPVKRPVKKLEHSLASLAPGEALDKEKLALFSRIAHSPAKVLMQEQGDSLILNALVRLRGIGLKPNEKEHVEELVKKIELGYLSELADRYKWLEREIAAKKSGLAKSGVPDKHKSKERETENLAREVASLAKELERFSAGKADVSERIKSEKADLEAAVLDKAGIRLGIILKI